MPNKEHLGSGKVLVVDDEPHNLKLVGEVLRRANIDFILSINGQEALDAIKTEKPDLVLLDVMMPGQDGFEVCKTLKADPETTPIPVIFLTAAATASDLISAFAAGAADYIKKPFMREELLARVSTHLQISEARQQLELEAQKRSELLARLAHDIKNPAGSVAGLASMIQLDLKEGRSGVIDELTSVLRLIINSAEGMVELVNGILDEARDNSENQSSIPSEAIQIEDVVAHLVGLNTPLAREQELQLIYERKTDFMAAISRRVLIEIFDNLISNALKYSRRGNCVTIRLLHSSVLSGGFRFEIEDSAKTIDAQQADELFKNFTRGEKSENVSLKSHGIGLSIVKRLVKLHSGEVGVINRDDGNGNIFYVELPATTI